MFTGIVQELGEVVALDRTQLTIRGPKVAAGAGEGDSIAVNGVCLTVVKPHAEQFSADVMQETFDRTTLAALAPGAPVNLEPAATLATSMGGHLVQGHVDGVGTILAHTPAHTWQAMRVGLPPGLAQYVVEKGSIAVDGVSLTVTAVTDEWFEVGLIPTTLELTTLGRKRAGDLVNLEVDVIAKYVEKQLAAHARAVSEVEHSERGPSARRSASGAERYSGPSGHHSGAERSSGTSGETVRLS